jgi:hypothetical protein
MTLLVVNAGLMPEGPMYREEYIAQVSAEADGPVIECVVKICGHLREAQDKATNIVFTKKNKP